MSPLTGLKAKSITRDTMDCILKRWSGAADSGKQGTKVKMGVVKEKEREERKK